MNSTLGNRAASFGIGARFAPLKHNRKPTPGKYENEISDFKKKNAGHTFGVSRQSYEKVFVKANKIPIDQNIPGPGAYKIPLSIGLQYSLKGRTKMIDTVAINVKNNIPGPGAYSSFSTISPKGNSFLSSIESSKAPLIGGSTDRFKTVYKVNNLPGPGNYTIENAFKHDKVSLSKYHSPKCSQFGSEARVFNKTMFRYYENPGPGAYEATSIFNQRRVIKLPKLQKKPRRNLSMPKDILSNPLSPTANKSEL
mmetsp:Transcript_42034/g.48737  ORF Transcript_42034/g.48737 Transcript_42034/m.48737 type:complete len:253 (-) Transcript_42034:55-813(-)